MYEGYGPSGDTPEEIRQDIRELLETDNNRYARGVDSDVGVKDAFAWLKQNL